MSKSLNKWDTRFIEIANTVASWSSCYQSNRQVGCVIAKDKRILTTGYNGAPSGVKNCKDKGCCLRQDLKIPSGTKHELCYAAHAEQNAIIQAARLGVSVDGATLYCTHEPCTICTKLIINAGISRIVYQKPYPDDFAKEILKEAGIVVEKV